MKLNKKSLHFKFWKKTNKLFNPDRYKPPSNFCTYFWQLIGNGFFCLIFILICLGYSLGIGLTLCDLGITNPDLCLILGFIIPPILLTTGLILFLIIGLILYSIFYVFPIYLIKKVESKFNNKLCAIIEWEE